MDKCRLVIIGLGGMGREALWLARAHNEAGRQPEYDVVGFVTNAEADHGKTVDGAPVLGPEEWLEGRSDVKAVCAIGDPRGRRRVVTALEANGVEFVTLAHPSALMSGRVTVGAGCILSAGAVVTTNVVLGDHVIVNVHASISHDATVEAFATIAPGVRLTGGVRIGYGADLGAGCVVIPRCSVGRGAVIGAGAVVVRDIENNWVAVGVPARPTRRLPEDLWL